MIMDYLVRRLVAPGYTPAPHSLLSISIGNFLATL